MMVKRLSYALAAAVIAGVLSAPSHVHSQQNPPCDNLPTAGKTNKQKKMDACNCEQASAQEKPTYRVGAAPFGGNAKPPAVRSARVGTRRDQEEEDENLYHGLEVPDLKDRRSPEVVGLLEQVGRARKAARQEVEDTLEKARKILQLNPQNWYANMVLKSPKVKKAYENFIALQNSGSWVSRPRFDWREQGIDVGPVLNQGQCQSCWAFAAMSVYQSSWDLEQHRLGVGFLEVTVPEYSTYQRIPSVQQLLNCIGKEKGNCKGGGWHGTAFAFMVSTHVPHIPDDVVWKKGERSPIEEYTGRVSRCEDTLQHRRVERGGKTFIELEGPDSHPHLPDDSERILTAYDRALAWGYVNEKTPDQLPTVAQLKKALIEHGPLAMPIRGDNCFKVYQGGVFNGHNMGFPNHVMVLIGWDDAKQAWLIKNSWGVRWGEKGFAWVAYGSNSIGLGAAWIQPTPSTKDQ
ncbi:MAG TPA: C1 family peptidase [Blastocatellia bacterium]|nr:C1 family peptidase [Blastocatellia bacterium]